MPDMWALTKVFGPMLVLATIAKYWVSELHERCHRLTWDTKEDLELRRLWGRCSQGTAVTATEIKQVFRHVQGLFCTVTRTVCRGWLKPSLHLCVFSEGSVAVKRWGQCRDPVCCLAISYCQAQRRPEDCQVEPMEWAPGYQGLWSPLCLMSVLLTLSHGWHLPWLDAWTCPIWLTLQWVNAIGYSMTTPSTMCILLSLNLFWIYGFKCIFLGSQGI